MNTHHLNGEWKLQPQELCEVSVNLSHLEGEGGGLQEDVLEGNVDLAAAPDVERPLGFRGVADPV